MAVSSSLPSVVFSLRASPRPNSRAIPDRATAQASVAAALTSVAPPLAANSVIHSATIRPLPLSLMTIHRRSLLIVDHLAPGYPQREIGRASGRERGPIS